jgi:hypothetical protein
MARNDRVFGYFQLTSQAGVDLLRCAAAYTVAYQKGLSRGETAQQLQAEIDGKFPSGYKSDFHRSEIHGAYGRQILLDNFGAFILVSIHGALRILFGTGLEMLVQLTWPQAPPSPPGSGAKISLSGTLSLWKTHLWLVPIGLLYLGFLALCYAAFAAGLFKLAAAGFRLQALFLLAGCAYVVAISSHQGYYRYRIPMMPFLSYGVAAFVSRPKISPPTKDLHA